MFEFSSKKVRILIEKNCYRRRVLDVFAAISPNRRIRGSVRNRESPTGKDTDPRSRPRKKLKKRRNLIIG